MEKYTLSKEEKQYLGYYVSGEGHNYSKNTGCAATVTLGPKICCIDCEFVETVDGEQVASIGMYVQNKDYYFKIKPSSKVTDYITEITGIDENTKYDMDFDELIIFLTNFINERDILLGHHLYGDLKNLNFYHKNIIDTCLMFPTPDGPPFYYSLKLLAKMHLKIDIQNGIHNPVEDAKTAYDLVKFGLDRNYTKLNWMNFGQTFIVSKENALAIAQELLKVDEKYIYCIYTRGSRPIGTNKIDSDYDLVIICDTQCNFSNGTLTKYGNIDVCIYDTEDFKRNLEYQYIWALEAIYCNKQFVFLEKINFREFAENIRNTKLDISNDYLSRSIGYETARKMASAKKHYINKDFHQARKHIFIAFRFVEYGRQIIKFGKIINQRNSNFIWFMMLSLKTNAYYNEFKEKWSSCYVNAYRQFVKLIPKKSMKYHNYSDNCNFHVYSHISFIRNFNYEILIIDLIQKKQIENFLSECPDYIDNYNKVIKLYDVLKLKLTNIYIDITTPKNVYFTRKDFSLSLDEYNKRYHKYLFLLYNQTSIEIKDLKFTSKRIYKDLFCEEHSLIKYVPLNHNPKEEWTKYQLDNAHKVIRYDFRQEKDIRYIGGLDISFDKKDNCRACSYITIYDVLENKIIYEDHELCNLEIPYISGYLAFREVPEYKKLLNKIVDKEFYPQLLLMDGFGILHNNKFGVASHLGVELDIPTIGIGKTLLNVDGLHEKEQVNKFKKVCFNKGDFIPIIGASGTLHGISLQTTDNVLKPLFVSIGHKICLETARNIVLKMCIYKIPEPIRNSDIKSKLFL
jgi:endonuclease V